MRNWNWGKNFKNISLLTVYRLPMRNWNRKRAGFKTATEAFIDYLWGIETLQKQQKPGTRYKFIDYLWGIETDSKGNTTVDIGSFIDYLWGIETFNRIALLHFHFPFIDYLWGIETFTARPYNVYRKYVYRLPMRNWNISIATNLPLTQAKFIDYLWGIETL